MSSRLLCVVICFFLLLVNEGSSLQYPVFVCVWSTLHYCLFLTFSVTRCHVIVVYGYDHTQVHNQATIDGFMWLVKQWAAELTNHSLAIIYRTQSNCHHRKNKFMKGIWRQGHHTCSQVPAIILHGSQLITGVQLFCMLIIIISPCNLKSDSWWSVCTTLSLTLASAASLSNKQWTFSMQCTRGSPSSTIARTLAYLPRAHLFKFPLTQILFSNWSRPPDH